MTLEEQRLADDRMRPEIAKLQAETAKLAAEAVRFRVDVRHVIMQTVLAPFVAGAAVAGGLAAIVKIFFT